MWRDRLAKSSYLLGLLWISTTTTCLGLGVGRSRESGTAGVIGVACRYGSSNKRASCNVVRRSTAADFVVASASSSKRMPILVPTGPPQPRNGIMFIDQCASSNCLPSSLRVSLFSCSTGSSENPANAPMIPEYPLRGSLAPGCESCGRHSTKNTLGLGVVSL